MAPDSPQLTFLLNSLGVPTNVFTLSYIIDGTGGITATQRGSVVPDTEIATLIASFSAITASYSAASLSALTATSASPGLTTPPQNLVPTHQLLPQVLPPQLLLLALLRHLLQGTQAIL